MLVLSRRAGESISLTGNISIHVLGVEGDRIKMGVDAPPEVIVLRSELVPNQQPGALVLAVGESTSITTLAAFRGLHVVSNESLLLEDE